MRTIPAASRQLTILIVIAAALLFSCQVPDTPETLVCVAGYRNNGTNDIAVAWSGTTLGGISAWHDLPIPVGTNPGYANSIAVSGGTISVTARGIATTGRTTFPWPGRAPLSGASARGTIFPFPSAPTPGMRTPSPYREARSTSRGIATTGRTTFPWPGRAPLSGASARGTIFRSRRHQPRVCELHRRIGRHDLRRGVSLQRDERHSRGLVRAPLSGASARGTIFPFPSAPTPGMRTPSPYREARSTSRGIATTGRTTSRGLVGHHSRGASSAWHDLPDSRRHQPRVCELHRRIGRHDLRRGVSLQRDERHSRGLVGHHSRGHQRVARSSHSRRHQPRVCELHRRIGRHDLRRGVSLQRDERRFPCGLVGHHSRGHQRVARSSHSRRHRPRVCALHCSRSNQTHSPPVCVDDGGDPSFFQALIAMQEREMKKIRLSGSESRRQGHG